MLSLFLVPVSSHAASLCTSCRRDKRNWLIPPAVVQTRGKWGFCNNLKVIKWGMVSRCFVFSTKEPEPLTGPLTESHYAACPRWGGGKIASYFLLVWIFQRIRTCDLRVRTSRSTWLKRMCSKNVRNVLQSQLWPRPQRFHRSFLLARSETGPTVSAESVKTAPNILTSEQQRKENSICTVWG